LRQENIPTSAPERAVRPLRILVADDQRDIVLTLSMLLQADGYEVRGAYDGSEALSMARDFDPDVLILDIGMPGLTGYDVARALHAEHGANCPTLIAMTGYSSVPEQILAKVAGFHHHFGKPARPGAIAELLAEIPPRI
jgi:CheY-like chemotaxis protein